MPEGTSTQSELLACRIRAIVQRQVQGIDNLGLMFSGGLDSTILAIAARKRCDVTLYTAGFEGSHDLEWVRECASIVDLPIIEIILDSDEVRRSVRRVVKTHGMKNPRWMSTFVGFDIVLSKVREEHAMCGQGADELFGGYRKYLVGNGNAMMAKDTKELAESEMPAYRDMAAHYGKTLLAPFLDAELVEFAGKLPIEMKLGPSGNKLILRDAARFLGLPGMIAEKPKKAMQYGSGISKAIKQYIKESGHDLKYLIEQGDL